MSTKFPKMKVGDVVELSYVPHKRAGHTVKRHKPGSTPKGVDYAGNNVGSHACWSHAVARKVKR